jgi:hypothetical protein
LQLPRLAVNPTCAVADKGKIIYNTTQNKVLFCDGTAWIDPATGGVPNNWVNSGANSYLSNLNGYVGIGTASPHAPLTIFNSGGDASTIYQTPATGTNSGNGLYVGVYNDGNSYLWSYENSNILFGTNASERMRLSASGNLGIGTSSPNQKLDVVGNGEISGNLTVSGNMGIGTTTPSQKLDVVGNAEISGNVTVNSGMGIVRSTDANQLAIVDFATPANLVWNLNAGATICCIGMGFSTFTARPSIAFGEITGSVTNPGFIVCTIESLTNSSAQIRVTNIGTANSTATGATLRAMIIGRK